MAFKCFWRRRSMVKIGFIVEGQTELILIQSTAFKNFLSHNNIELVNVINADGSGNLLPHNIEGYIQILEKSGAEKIFILTDLDRDICITKTKERISARPQDIVIIAVKTIEAWFLACTPVMQLLLDDMTFSFPEPEKEDVPFQTINDLLIHYTGRGIGRAAGKIKLVTRLLKLGLDLSLSASHANCPSAKYFMQKISEVARTAAA